MRRRRDDAHRREERDLVLGRALDELEAPDYPPDFLAAVWARVDEAAPSAEGAAPDAVPPPARHAPRRPWFRRPAFAGIAVATVFATVVAVLVLVGVPGISRMSGPEPVSAARVIQKALRAISSGETLVMAVTETGLDGYSGSGEALYRTTEVRLAVRSDGSYRLVQTDVAPLSAANGRPRKGYEGSVYDARSGVRRHYVQGWEEDAGRYMHEAEVTSGWPLGPPDDWVSMESGLQSVALALRSAGRAAMTTTSFQGRPAWVISATGIMAVRDRTERTAVTIDSETCLPVRVQSWKDGVLQLEYTWRYVSRNVPLPEATFTSIPLAHMKVTHDDAGFRRWPLETIASRPGYVVLLPTWLPAGYRQQWVAAAAHSTTANEVTEGRNVAALQYVRGFDGLTVTTRIVANPEQAARVDPVEWEVAYAALVTRDVVLTRGAFAGATARVVVAPGITTPHLYAVHGDVMLTISGAATAKELLAMAESLRPYATGTAGQGHSGAGD